MKQVALLSGVVLLLAACHCANSAVPLRHVSDASTPTIDQPVPPFVLPGAHGKIYALADFQRHSVANSSFAGVTGVCAALKIGRSFSEAVVWVQGKAILRRLALQK